VAPDAALGRLGAVQETMLAHVVDLLVIGPSANLQYVLGYRPLATDRLFALIVSPTRAVAVAPDFEAAEFTRRTGFDNVIPWTDREGPKRAVADAFGQLGSLPPEPTSVVDEELPFRFFSELSPFLGRRLSLAATLLGELRLVKEPEEQERIARTGALVSRAVDLFQERVQAGMTELEVKRILESFLWDEGADSVDYVLVQTGANSAHPHHVAGKDVLEQGETVLVDIAVCLDGYFADITQQTFLGEPSTDYAEAYAVVLAAQEAGVAAANCGARVEDVAIAASTVLAGAGYGEWMLSRVGHGLGVEVHEPPSVLEGNGTEIQTGFVFTVEPGVYFPGRFGIRIEDTVVVTEAGPTRVTRGARPLHGTVS
jgi:Xaa-Pro aminopeptidase